MRAFGELWRNHRGKCHGFAPGAVLATAAGVVTFAMCVRIGEAGPAPEKPEGERLARTVCSACHVVAAQQEGAPILRNAATNFCEIANRPNTTTHSLARFVTHAHWDEQSSTYTMPNPGLLPD